MKKIAKKIVLKTLKALAKHRLSKYKGKIIAITGSVGKTSTKDAVFTVLNSQFKVRRNKGSMNSDFGLLLTILDIESGFSSATKWTWYIIKGFIHSLMSDHSEILLLELGVDKVGDMDFLTSVVNADIAIFTNISPIHIDDDQFSGMREIFDEKIKLLKALKEDGTAIFNIDNNFLNQAFQDFKSENKIGFGAENSEVLYPVTHITNTIEGLSFLLKYNEEEHLIKTQILGAYQIYVLLPAIICGLKLGMDIETIKHAIERFTLPAGRMSIIKGIKDSTILDSSYNSSPLALKEALKILKEIGKDSRKVAILGNMNELGKQSEELHSMIGKIIPEYTDLLITVGTQAKFIAQKAMERGMNPLMIFQFTYTKEAMEFFKKHIKENDIILVKGSQNRVRLERLIKEIMKNPEDAEKLLVRQSKTWQAKL